MEQTIDQQQLPTPPEKTNSFLVTLLSVLLLISVFIAGFFAYQTQSLVKELNTLKVVSTPNVAVSPSPDPTANWKTYTNTELAVEFKYPSDWSLTDTNQNGRVIFGPALDGLKVYTVTVEVNGKANGQEISSYVTNLVNLANSGPMGGIRYDSKENVSISGQNGIVLHNVFAYDQNEERIYVIVNDRAYRISYPSGDENENILNPKENYDVVQQILSTFKFIQPTASTSPLPVACTMEAKICPDGSAVGRSGPNCEFAPCPTTSPQL